MQLAWGELPNSITALDKLTRPFGGIMSNLEIKHERT